MTVLYFYGTQKPTFLFTIAKHQILHPFLISLCISLSYILTLSSCSF